MSKETVQEPGKLVYVLSPVRQVTDEQRAEILKHVELLKNEGFKVFDPHDDAPQKDETGYNIVVQELNFLYRIAQEGGKVDVLWNLGGTPSEGSRVDVGIAKALGLELNLVQVFDKENPTGPQAAYQILQKNCQYMLTMQNMLRRIKRREEAIIDWNTEMRGEVEEWQRIRLGLALGLWVQNPNIRIKLGRLTGIDPPDKKSYPKVMREIEKIV